MESLEVNDLDKVGLIEDTRPHIIPPNGWSELSNVRCKDGSITPFGGSAEITTPSVSVECITEVTTADSDYLVYAGGQKIYSYSSTSETDISHRTFIGSGWDCCVLGGVAIFNNGTDCPVYWGGSGQTVNLPYNSNDGCDWCVAGIRAKTIRSFKNYLIALNVDDGNGFNPQRIVWSDAADPGSVPSTWDISDSTADAGDVQLSDTPGEIIDGLTLRDTFVIYKDDSIYGLTYRGDSLVFNLRLIHADKGLYAKKAVADVGGRHVFVSTNKDIYLFDGVNAQSIADQRIKDAFFSAVNPDEKEKVFCVFDEKYQECWICYPSTTSTNCDAAYVYSVTKNAWSKRDLPGANCATFGIADLAPENTWNDYSGTTWADNAGATWRSLATDPQVNALIMGGDKLYEMNTGNQDLGSNITCTAQRTHLDVGRPSDWHTILRIYPKASGGAFTVKVGTHEEISDTISWSAGQTFTPGTDYKLDFRATGRLHGIEFSSAADVNWEISGYEFQFAPSGRR